MIDEYTDTIVTAVGVTFVCINGMVANIDKGLTTKYNQRFYDYPQPADMFLL